MYKKFLSILLIALLFQMICLTPVSAAVKTDGETTRVAAMKERINVNHLEKKRVVITRRDKTKLKGFVSQIEESSFVIRDERTGATSEIKFEDVAQVKTKGNGLSTGMKVLIGVGIAAAVVVLVLVVKPLGKSPFPRCNADQSNAPCSTQ